MQCLFRLAAGLVVGGHFVGIVVVDLIEGIAPRPQGLRLVVLQSPAVSIAPLVSLIAAASRT